MIPWILLEKVSTSKNNEELTLYQRDAEYSIKVGNHQLMNSRAHKSEDALGKLACAKISGQAKQNVLIGGLGMGFTLRVALNNLKANARVTVAELLPAVVKWNRTFLAHLANNPLDDKRVSVYEGDVGKKINTAQDFYDCIVLDVDNGPQGMTQKGNDNLYTIKGLKAAYAALKSKGILAIWSASPDIAFTKRLQKTGFKVEETRVYTHAGRKGGGQAIVWIAQKSKQQIR